MTAKTKLTVQRTSLSSGGWQFRVHPADKKPDEWWMHVCIRDTTCCGLKEAFGFQFKYNLTTAQVKSVLEALLDEVMLWHLGGLLWVFVQYAEGQDVEYNNVLTYLIKHRKASVCTPFWNDNSGHLCTVLVHTVDPAMHDHENWEYEDEQDDGW